jgi:hypothetical protein
MNFPCSLNLVVEAQLVAYWHRSKQSKMEEIIIKFIIFLCPTAVLPPALPLGFDLLITADQVQSS